MQAGHHATNSGPISSDCLCTQQHNVLLHGIRPEIFPGTNLKNACMPALREKALLTSAHIRNLKTGAMTEFPQNRPFGAGLEKILYRFEVLRRAG